MYAVTNRSIKKGKRRLAMFGETPSEKGPNELRLLKVDKTGKK